MKIYFGASISLGRKYLNQCRRIVKAIKFLGHHVLSEYVVDPNLVAGVGLKPVELFKRETGRIEKADLMIAEVSQASWGTAFLMEHALKHNIPVLALYYQDNHAKLSPMVAGHPELYLVSYDEDNLKTVLEFNLRHFSKRMSCQGKLIVIDGSNGSGKATQTELLMKYFRQHKIAAKHISYPRYYTSFHGKTVGRFLKGEFGKLKEVSPYLSSLAYALDRLTSKNQILDWLESGQIVVADRYVTSSLAHQAVKLKGKEREKIINWIYEMEYKQHRMPKENIVIYLYVAPEIADKLILQKAKKYRGKQKRDIEEGLAYQRQVTNLYLQLVKKYRHWVKIDCLDRKGQLKSKKQIHDLVVQTLQDRKILLK
jgi:dTMP kinase